MSIANVPRTLRVAAVLTLTVVLLIASASCQRDRVVAPVAAPSAVQRDVTPAANLDSIQLHYLCANRFRVRNRNDFAVAAQWIVIGTSDSGAVALPARPAGAPYSETYFDVPDSGTVRLFVSGVRVASATGVQRACKTHELVLRVDSGVVVTSPALDSSYPAGTSAPYSFAAAPGYTHLLVALDDTLVPTSGTVVMSRSHVLWAAADVDVTLPSPANPLVMELKGLLTAADPVAAYQQLLDDVGTIFDAVGPDEASRQLKLAGLAAYDVLRDSAALIRVDNALAQHAFTLGSGEYDGSGSGGGVIVISDKTPGGAGDVRRLSDGATGPCAPLRAPVAPPSSEPTRIVYVNGINTTPDEAVDADVRLGCALRASGQFVKSKFRMDHFYNRTWSVQFREDAHRNVWCALAAASWRDYWSQLTQAVYFSGCATQAAVIALRTNDYVEATTEFVQVESNAPNVAEDAVSFSAYLDGHRRTDGEHLIIVGHSQGNLVTQQAVQRLRDSARFAPKSDSLCIGAVAVAAPTSANWPLDKSLLLGLQIPGDLLVSITRANHFQSVSTPLSDSLAAVIAELHSEVTNASDAEERRALTSASAATQVAVGARIHSFTDGYLAPAPTRDVITDDVASIHRQCTLGQLALTPMSANLRVQATLPIDLSARNRDGGDMKLNRRVQWNVSSGLSLSNNQKRVTAIAPGSASVTTTVFDRHATSSVEIPWEVLAVSLSQTLHTAWGLDLTDAPAAFPAPGAGAPPSWDGNPATCTGERTVTAYDTSTRQTYTWFYIQDCWWSASGSLQPPDGVKIARYEWHWVDAGDREFFVDKTKTVTDPVQDMPVADLVQFTGWGHLEVWGLDANGIRIAHGLACIANCGGTP